MEHTKIGIKDIIFVAELLFTIISITFSWKLGSLPLHNKEKSNITACSNFLTYRYGFQYNLTFFWRILDQIRGELQAMSLLFECGGAVCDRILRSYSCCTAFYIVFAIIDCIFFLFLTSINLTKISDNPNGLIETWLIIQLLKSPPVPVMKPFLLTMVGLDAFLTYTDFS